MSNTNLYTDVDWTFMSEAYDICDSNAELETLREEEERLENSDVDDDVWDEFLERELEEPGRRTCNQPVVRSLSPDTDEEGISEAVRRVFSAHPALLTVVRKTQDGWRQHPAYQNNAGIRAVEVAEEEAGAEAAEEEDAAEAAEADAQTAEE